MALNVSLDDIKKLEDRMREVDIDVIDRYIEKLADIRKVTNTMIAPGYIQDFIIAYDVTNNLLSTMTGIYNMSEILKDTAEANAFMTRATPYLESVNQKDTVEAKKQFIALDPIVQRATMLNKEAERLMQSLRIKLQTFRMAHDAVKKMAYTSDNNNSGFEGF